MDAAWAAETVESATETGGHWQLAMVVAAIGFLSLFSRWRKGRRASVSTAREFRERDREPDRHRDAADKAIVELLETSRALNAQVDTKIRMLNRLVKDAEEQCARLEKLLARAEHGDPADDEEGRGETGVSGDAVQAAPGETAFLSELHERIHRLREDGKNVGEIARATNLSITEVEFIVRTL